jgi:hypothetical protein
MDGTGRGAAANAVPFKADQRLPDFDWAQLYRRFEDDLQACETEEAQLVEDLNRLMAVRALSLSLGPDLTGTSISTSGFAARSTMSRRDYTKGAII